ncbi:hypothetical protein KQI84_06215 [bacterium]|nr:hypothetical protein [bacterium]
MAEEGSGNIFESTTFWRVLVVVLLLALAGVIVVMKSPKLAPQSQGLPNADEVVQTLQDTLERRNAGEQVSNPRYDQLNAELDEMEKEIAAKDEEIRALQQQLGAMDMWLKNYSENELPRARQAPDPEFHKKAIAYYNGRVGQRNELKEKIDGVIADRNDLSDRFNAKVDELNEIARGTQAGNKQ